MWQITWALGLLPDWVWSALLVVGILAIVASAVLGVIPFVKQYKLPIQIGGIISVVVSVWFLGAASNEDKWQAKIKDLEDKVKIAEEKSNNTNTEIQEKVITKTKIIKEQGKTQIEYIDRVVTQDKEVIKFVENCPIPKVIIDEHNAAAEMNKAAERKK